MASPPWAASPGGPYGSSPPKFVMPWKKSLSLTKHKGETPRPSPEKLRVGGGGRPEAPARGGWDGLRRAEEVARPRVTSALAVAAGLQQPACLLKSFALKSEEEKLLTQFKAGRRFFKKERKKRTPHTHKKSKLVILQDRPPASLLIIAGRGDPGPPKSQETGKVRVTLRPASPTQRSW